MSHHGFAVLGCSKLLDPSSKCWLQNLNYANIMTQKEEKKKSGRKGRRN
jgi:hypothetical protein